MPDTRPTAVPYGPSPELARIRDEHPLVPLAFPDGHVGWLATGHAQVRAVVADPRFSSRQELMHLPTTRAGEFAEVPPATPGMFINMDAPEHTRYRSLLTGRFTVRRMRQLTERIEQITAERLDAMERGGPTADLVEAFAQPIPALVICELLGVPYDDHETFQRQAAALSDHAAALEDVEAAIAGLGNLIYGLVVAKRAEPADDLLSDLTDSDLTDEELAGIGFLLLGAGLDTTANMLGLGTFVLLTHPEQLAVLRREPDLVDGAVEELMRYLSIAHTGIRVALEDVEIGGHLISAGQSVVLSAPAANRDPDKFPDPDAFDVRRKATGHVSFGHGIHQCLGQQLARVEMRVAFRALFERFPGLRLAVPAEDVPLRDDSDIHGVRALPVTWDEV
ncbi:cytochrome P450 [Nocardiopsis sp. NPDC050513]|uniref:cytochrome P450 n=1 Tax=Nocardiopsis sp. NPDC050513 TaxID=3364338 RepID=UPI0037B98F27